MDGHFSQAQKNLPVTLVSIFSMKNRRKVEPCEPSPDTAEVAADVNRAVAHAELSSGQVCVWGVVGKDRLGGRFGVESKKPCKCIMINGRISRNEIES